MVVSCFAFCFYDMFLQRPSGGGNGSGRENMYGGRHGNREKFGYQQNSPAVVNRKKSKMTSQY